MWGEKKARSAFVPQLSETKDCVPLYRHSTELAGPTAKARGWNNMSREACIQHVAGAAFRQPRAPSACSYKCSPVSWTDMEIYHMLMWLFRTSRVLCRAGTNICWHEVTLSVGVMWDSKVCPILCSGLYFSHNRKQNFHMVSAIWFKGSVLSRTQPIVCPSLSETVEMDLL